MDIIKDNKGQEMLEGKLPKKTIVRKVFMASQLNTRGESI